MKFWWITNPSRLEQERAAVEALATEASWFNLSAWKVDGGRLSMDGELVAHDHGYAVRLLYPDWTCRGIVPLL